MKGSDLKRGRFLFLAVLLQCSGKPTIEPLAVLLWQSDGGIYVAVSDWLGFSVPQIGDEADEEDEGYGADGGVEKLGQRGDGHDYGC